MTSVKGRIQNSLSGFLRLVVVALLVAIQIIIIFGLTFMLRQYSVYFYAILEICSLFVAVGLTNANKNSSFKVAWLAIALLLPISGHVMYYFWGRNSSRRKMVQRTQARIAESYHYLTEKENVQTELHELKPEALRISKYMSAQKFPLFINNETKYYSMGDYVFQDLFCDLLEAKKFIFVNFFIVAKGVVWDILHEILVMKAKEGVEVLFIYDDFGAMVRTDKYFCESLNQEGIRTVVFNPIKKYTDKLVMNYRTHQKIVVIDGEVGYTGGFNVADEYANLIERFGVWKDCGIRLEGDGVWGLSMTFLQMWSLCEPNVRINYMKYKSDREYTPNQSFCHVISDGPVKPGEQVIESIYKQMIADADKFVYIMTPYLILEEHMITTLCEAVIRGVDVRIVTPNIPDKKNVKMLTNYNYGPLLNAGVKIYEYTPGFIHSKVIINDFSAIVGTVNMDYRSFYLHYENAVWICNDSTMDDILQDFENTFIKSHEYSYSEWLQRPLFYKMAQPLLNLFSTLV